jgi:dTDP-glucose 4,6-dehydratase
VRLFRDYRPRAIVHLAAENHVDARFVTPAISFTRISWATSIFWNAPRTYWQALPEVEKKCFVFLHVSIDEVMARSRPRIPRSLRRTDIRRAAHTPRQGGLRSPRTCLFPQLWAAGDHYQCSKNYGPRQFLEKLIALMIQNALNGKPLSVYGDGLNARDWLLVIDHCAALRAVLVNGRGGETYNIGGDAEMTNIEVVRMLCALLDEMKPHSLHKPHDELHPIRQGPAERRSPPCNRLCAEGGRVGAVA